MNPSSFNAGLKEGATYSNAIHSVVDLTHVGGALDIVKS